MQEVNVTPELRFPDFENGTHMQDYLFKFCEVNPTNGDLPEKFIYIDLESVNAGRLEKENVINKDQAPSRAQRILAFGDILYQTVRPYQRNNYHFKLEGDYVASTGYAQIRNPDCPEYYYQLFHTDKFVNKVLRRCTGTSYPAINSTDLEKIPIIVPQNEEQQKIASFLTAVDERIQGLQKKKAKLEEYKKGVMQQIFSQQIRFKIENEDGELVEPPDWEEKKLGELCSFFSGGTPSSTNKEYYSGNIPFIGSGEIGSRFTEKRVTLAAIDNSSAKIVEEGDLLYAMYGATSGQVAISKINGAINQAVLCIRTTTINKKLLFYLLDFHRDSITSKYLQGGQGNLSAKIISNLKFLMPNSLPEQLKIASFLSLIDESIQSLGKQLESTTLFKKGLLQKMFV